jgi:hypothetical protein
MRVVKWRGHSSPALKGGVFWPLSIIPNQGELLAFRSAALQVPAYGADGLKFAEAFSND